MKKSQDAGRAGRKLVVRAFVTYQGKVLLLQRDIRQNLKNPGLWQFPGGGIEAGEEPDEAIFRELAEEISLVPRVINFLGEFIPGRYLYHAPLSENEARKIKKGQEGKDLKFFFFSELSKIPVTPKLRAVFATHKKFLKLLAD